MTSKVCLKTFRKAGSESHCLAAPSMAPLILTYTTIIKEKLRVSLYCTQETRQTGLSFLTCQWDVVFKEPNLQGVSWFSL